MELTWGEGRVKISLSARKMGNDFVVHIFNENAHIGAVAVGEYHHQERRTSTSVITRLGHKDDLIAQKAAYLISKHTRRASCVVAGVHLSDVTQEEIQRVIENTDSLVKDFLERWEQNEEKFIHWTVNVLDSLY